MLGQLIIYHPCLILGKIAVRRWNTNDNGRDRVALAQAYIHLKPFEASQSRFQRLYDVALRVAQRVTQEHYGPGYAVYVQTDEGSWRAWITALSVAGSSIFYAANSAYDWVAKYPEFKKGLKELCEDSQRFDEIVCETLLPKTGAKDNQVYVVQRRKMVPGKIYTLLAEIERLEEELPRLTNTEALDKLEGIRFRTEQLASMVAPQDFRAITNAVKQRKIPALPLRVRPPIAALRVDDPSYASNAMAVNEYRFDPNLYSIPPTERAREQLIVINPRQVTQQ